MTKRDAVENNEKKGTNKENMKKNRNRRKKKTGMKKWRK